MKRVNKSYLAFFMSLFIIGCSTDDEDFSRILDLKGKAQKGPFITGSDITVSELSSDLNPTGRVFNSTILDDQGTFLIPEIQLESEFIEVRVEGNYYNEVTGDISFREVTITSLANIRDNETTNVNILTQLEDQRVRNLISEGMSFDEAKNQSFSELKAVFGIESLDISLQTNELDLGVNQASGAFLFAASAIISNVEDGRDFNSVSYAAWLKFLLDFEHDFGDNGQVDSDEIHSQLFFAAYGLNRRIDNIRPQLQSTFDQLGSGFEIPNFEPFIQEFLSNSPVADTVANVESNFLPESTLNGINILRLENGSVLETNKNYVIAVQPPTDFYYEIRIDISALADDSTGGFSAPSMFWNHSSFQPPSSQYNLFIQSDSIQVESIEIPVGVSSSGKIELNIDWAVGNFVIRNEERKELFW